MDKIRKLDVGIFDYTHPNIMKFTAMQAEASLKDIDDYFTTVCEMLDTSTEPFVILFDATKSKWAGNKERIALGKGTKEMEKKYADRYKKTFLVIPNTIVNMLLRGVNVVARPKIKQVIFSKLPDAEEAAHTEVGAWAFI